MELSYFLPFLSAIFVAVLSTVQAEGLQMTDALVHPCNVGDMICLKKSTEKFLQRTYKGIPELNILPIDPLFIPAEDVAIDGEGLAFENRNIVVQGLKDQKLADYKMDLKKKSVSLTTAADLIINDDVTGVFGLGKRIPGHSSSRGRVLTTASYNYELKKDAKGVEHFVLGPETVSCKLVDPPSVQYNPELARTLSSDAEAKSHSTHSHPDKKFCSIVEKAYTSVVHNIRAAARALPASAFFNDVSADPK